MEVDEYAAKINAYITEYIKFGDAKAGSVLAVVSAIGAVVAATADSILGTVKQLGSLPVTVGMGLGVVLVVSVAMALLRTLLALQPRTKKAATSLNSFPDIAELQAKDYVTRLLELKAPSAIAEQYASHNIALARIAKEKFDEIGKSIFWLRFALLSAYGLALLYAVAKAFAASV